MYDRRSCCRWQINCQAKVKFPERGEFTDCSIADINFKGMRIVLDEKLEKDKFVNFTLALSDELAFDVEAWVVWCGAVEGRNSYGFFFTRISDSDKEEMSQFIFDRFPEEINKTRWQDIKVKKGGEKMEDRRIFERFTARFPLRFLSLGENKEGQAVSQDISAKGIGFVTNEALTLHTPLEIWLQVPDKGEPVYARGEVVWSKMAEPTKHRVGVELEEAEFMNVSRVLRAMKAK